MKKYFYLFFLISYLSFAQNEANIWYFGNNAGLDFNSGSPVALTNGALQTLEGCATISNPNGELLFYTDGTTVWNKNHVPMLNGTGLNGNFSSTQSAIIVPKPNSSSIYYIFTVDELGQPNGLQYSEVDMTLDNGLGGVTPNKNILLFTPVLEKLTAVEHDNGTDIWVIAHENGSANFRSYLVTSSGVQTTPVITNIGLVYSGDDFDDNAGYMKLSPDGSRLAMVFPKNTNALQLFDFNTTTGVLSNHLDFFQLTGGSEPYGVEFSPSGELLYLSGSGGVMQLDLTLDTPFDISFNAVILVNNPFFTFWGAAQLATDGKIYITSLPNDNFPPLNTLSVINNPDTLGIGCDFQQNVIPLGSGIAQIGLPPFIQSFFNVKIIVDNNCFGNPTQFSYDSNTTPDSITWDFGDGNTSSVDSPSHTYNSAGDYTVSVTVTANGETTTDTQDITIFEQPVANPIPDQIGCVESPFFTYIYDLSIHDDDILGNQDPSQFSLNYYSDIVSYNNNQPLDNPQMIELMVGGSADFVVSIQNNNNPECEDFTIIHVDVLQSPGINNNLPELSLCDNDSVGNDEDGLIELDLTQIELNLLNDGPSTDITINYYTDVNFTNLIITPENYQNTIPNEIIYIEVFYNSTPECKSTTSFSILVEHKPVIQNNVSLLQCDNDTDGLSTFNLTTAEPDFSTDFSNLVFTYFESLTDAQNGINSIANADNYQNEIAFTDTVWVRAENNTGCFSIAELTLNVSATQIPSDFMIELYQCEDISETGVATFDLSSANADIIGLFAFGQSIDITYYQNENDALTDSNPILNIANYQNTNSPNTQNIYIKVENTMSDACAGLGHHVTLNVLSLPIANPVIIEEQCDDNGDGLFAFDTSTIQDTIINGQADVSVEYYDELGNLLPSPLPNPFNTSTQDITARIINQNSTSQQEVCFDETVISFTVQDAVNANPIVDYKACDDDNDGIAEFDISNLETQLLNGQTQVDIIYIDADGNLLPNPLPNPFVTETTTIIARVESAISEACFDETSISFQVYAQPTANVVEDILICDDLNDSQESLVLSDLTSQVVGNQSLDDFEIQFFNTQNDADANVNPLAESIQINTLTDTLFARIQNIENNLCYDTSTFDVSLSYQPTAFTPPTLSACDDETNDQIEFFDLSQQDQSVLNAQSPDENNISYHISLEDAVNNANPINNDFENTTNPQTVFVRVENNINANCYSVSQFDVQVFETPYAETEDFYTLCENENISIGIEDNYDEYLWSTGDITPNILVSEPGNYELIIANNYSEISCENILSFNVISSNPAIITDIIRRDWRRGRNSIQVSVSGQGDYEYSIDGMNYQDSDTFTNLEDYEYLVHVRDKNGCGETLRRVFLLDYPDFFTPNGDGFNDRWQIINAKQEIFSKIYIFDRYGKLVADINPSSSGWDGTSNGKPMPSNDYWFKVERHDGRVHSGHFTLKR